MPVTQSELGRRLRAARENCGLTQESVATALGIPRTAVVQLEAGQRSVNSLELDRLARLYGRSVSEFVSDEAFQDDPVLALFRSNSGVSEDPEFGAWLRKCSNLCREATRLEGLLGYPQPQALAVQYPLTPPSSRWDAITQGRLVADQERNRLGLGFGPVWEIVEVVRGQGVRAAEHAISTDISGMFLHGRDLGAVIIVNADHAEVRKHFSYAHEYCHVLVDRGRPATVSRVANRDELAEVRANVFAAHFLMPETGVRAFLQSLGKGEGTRQVHEVYDPGIEQTPAESPGVAAQRRATPGAQAIQVHDVVRLAHHFGVSYDAALFHLLNLKLLPKDAFDRLREQQAVAGRLRSALAHEPNERPPRSLAGHLTSLALEAYRRDLISRAKLFELGQAVGISSDDLDAAIGTLGRETPAADVVRPGRA